MFWVAAANVSSSTFDARRRQERATRTVHERDRNMRQLRGASGFHMSTCVVRFMALLFGACPASATPTPDETRSLHYSLTPSGTLGAWLLSGPCQDFNSIASRSLPGLNSACPNERWQSVANPAGDFDWGALLNLPNGARATAAFGAWLRAETAFDGWLLISADGAVKVALDGVWVHVRPKPHQRGRALVPIPVHLSPGFHPLLVALDRYGNRANFTAQLRNRADHVAPENVAVYLPNGSSQAQLTERLLSVTPSLEQVDRSPELQVEVAFPSGIPASGLPVEFELHDASKTTRNTWKAGSLVPTAQRAASVRIHVPLLGTYASNAAITLLVRVGPVVVTRQLWLTPNALANLARAWRAEATLPETQPFDETRATLDAHIAAVTQSSVTLSRDEVEQATARLARLTSTIERGESPFLQAGQVHAALRSRFDHRPTELLAVAPNDFVVGDQQRRPLVVLLHGYNGSPQRILDAFLDNSNGVPGRALPGFVLAPAAHGNSFYRGPGERSVLDAIDWALSTYPIDETRVSITGVSMGGTGAAEIAFRNSHRFAAVAPLCGYHSYFVRRDTSNKPQRSWERRLMHQFSPASIAESGQDIPMYLAHGTKDLPLENSKVLTARYRALGYSFVEDWPDVGHAVWKRTYRNAGLFPWLTQWKKDLDPMRVVLASTSTARGQKFWVKLVRLARIEAPATVDARVVSPGHVVMTTQGVEAITLGPSRHLDANTPWLVTIDGVNLTTMPGKSTRTIERLDGTWTTSNLRDDAGSITTGPWSELFSEPYVAVYGSGNPATTTLNREVASRLVKGAAGVDLQIPVLSDAQFDATTSPVNRVLYVGRVDDHRYLAALRDSLPIRLNATNIQLGSSEFSETDVGIAFVYPDPNRRERLLGVVSANGPEGLWRVLALPGLLPDFVLFDHDVDAAAGEPILGPDASVRAAGFFQADGSLPGNFLDPWAKPRSRDSARP
jgi:predicted esterase